MKQRFLIGLLVFFGLLLCARAAFSMPATGLDATNDDGFIELSWTEPTDVATASTYAYAVQRSSSGSVPWIDISDSLPEGSTEYTDVNTINNETWYYRVAAWTDSDTAYSNIVFETAYYPQRISGLTASPTFICYETNGSPDSSAITFNLYAGPGASAAKKVTITLLEAGGEIGTITIYEPASGIHTVYWDGSWGDMAATSIGANTWVAAMGTGDDWIKHNGTYGMEARATNYNDDESDVAGTGTSIGVNVVHIQRPVTIEHTVIGNNPPAYVPPYKVTYQLTKEAYVTIRIYKETATGGLGTLVRRIEEDVPRPGEQAERNLTNTQFWDGKNDTGLIVPNGKYIMTLEAHEASGCETPPEDYADTVEIVWAVDVLRLTDWDEVHITPTNPTGSISYTLSHDANCTIAIYPEGTQFTDDFPNTDPVIILVGGGPREAGSHTEEWVGLDSDGLLVPNAVYTYTISAKLHGVKAVDYVGNDCPFYGTIVVNREPHEIDPPAGLTSLNLGGGNLQLIWTAPTNDIGETVIYKIYRDTQPITTKNASLIAATVTNTTEWIDTGLPIGQNLYYRVTATDSARPDYESEFSNMVSLAATHIRPSIASISMTNLDLEADSAIITYTVTNGPARQVEITIIDQQTGQEIATIVKTVEQNGVCTASWNGVWTSEQGVIKHNGQYSVKARAMDVDNSLSGWTEAASPSTVDVVHIQQPVEIEYTTEGENPPVLGPNYHITYQLTKSAYLVHKIYTDTVALVRTISSDVPRMGEGVDRTTTVTDYWDLRATNGSFVPNGIYHWQITAYYQGDTSTVTFDLPVQPLRLTDLTTVGIAQSEDKAQINYTLTTDATVTIKIYAPGTTFTGGLDDNGNPIPEDASALVKTLTFSRGKGSHTESWDGTNDTGQVVANDIYMMSIIALDSHRNRAVDYNGSECPFYGTIPVYRGITPPTLSWTGESGYTSDGVNPDKDKAGDTFTYRISYAHQDNTPLLAPPTLHILKGGTEIDTELMTGVDPYDQTYSDSKLYTVDVSLTDTGADYSYYFEARDINGIPATGIPTRSIVGYMKNGPIVDNTPLVTINQIDRGGFPEIDCYVTVTDQAGDHLGGLISGDFTVTEGGGGFDGTPNTVGSPTAALSTALVMDYSGSMLDPDVVNAEAAANIFVNNMADTDRAAVVKFDETVSLIRGFTSNKGLLRNAISTPYSRGATAFYDAVYLGLEETAKQQGRKAIVAFTDGLDNSSTHTVGEVVTYAKNNSIPIFTIGLGEANEQVLTSMAQGTGGQFYSAPTSAELITIFEEISTALSNQYLVSYNTNRDTPDGQIRDVTIGVCYLGKCEEDGTTYQSPADTSPPAGAPDTPSWSAGEFSNSTDITCAWDLGNAQDTGSDIVGYYLQVGADPTTFTYQMVFDDRVGNVKSYKIENLTEGRTYYARVSAENGSGLYSNWSGISKGIRIVTTLTNLTVSSPNIEPLSGLPLLASEGDSIAISFESFKGAFKEVVVTITDVIKKEEAAVLKVYDLPSHGDTITTIYWNGIWTEGGGWHKHNSCYSVAVEAIEYGDTSTVIAGGLFCVDVVHIQLPVLIEYTTSGEKPPVIVPSYKLTYQLTKDAYVTHSVYTDTGLLVRTIESNTPRIGEWLDRDQKNVAFWDMRSHDGSLVPNGIYYWEIMATDGEDTSVPVYVRVPVQPLRLTDLSAVGISEDGGEGGGNEAQINYTMTASAAVTIKIYEPGTKFTGALDTAGNPVSSDTTALVRTLGPFSRGEGSYSEIWNGRDNDGHLVDNGIYIYSITATDAHGNRAVDLAGNDAPFFGDIPVQQSAEEEEPEEPEFSETTVYAYPNPVMVSRGDVVTFRYALSEAADVTIKVYTITGEILWEKEILNQSAGIYKNENWDVRNKGGKSVASGLYIYSVQKNDDKPIIKKLIVIR